MTIMLQKVVLSTPSTPVVTSFSQVIADIIRAAHAYFGEEVYYRQDTKDLLQRIVLNLQPRGYFFWTTEEQVKSFSAPSEVIGGDGLNYTCYQSHTSTADTKPITGAYWTRYWYEGGEAGAAWVTATDYVATGDFYPDSDTLEIQHARIRYNDGDYPVKLISEIAYNEIARKTETGRPTLLYFSDKITPRVFLWPQPSLAEISDYLLILTRTRKLKNLDGKTEIEEDFKAGVWTLPLVKILAYNMAMQRVKSQALDLNWVAFLKKDADEAMENARRLKTNKVIEREGG